MHSPMTIDGSKAPRGFRGRRMALPALALLALTLGGCGWTGSLTSLLGPARVVSRPPTRPHWVEGTIRVPDLAGFLSRASWLVTSQGVYAAFAGPRPSHSIGIWYAAWPKAGQPLELPAQPRTRAFLRVGPHQTPLLLGSPAPLSVLVAVEDQTGTEADVVASVWLVSRQDSRRLADLLTAFTRPYLVRGQAVATATAGVTVLGIGVKAGFPDPYVPRSTAVFVSGPGQSATQRTCRLPQAVPPADIWPMALSVPSRPYLVWLRQPLAGARSPTQALLQLTPACATTPTGPSSATPLDALSLPAKTAVLWPDVTMVAGSPAPALTGAAGLQGSVLKGWQRTPTGLHLAWQIRTGGAAVIPMTGPYALISEATGPQGPTQIVDLQTGLLSPPLPAGNVVSAGEGDVILQAADRLEYVRNVTEPALG